MRLKGLSNDFQTLKSFEQWGLKAVPLEQRGVKAFQTPFPPPNSKNRTPSQTIVETYRKRVVSDSFYEFVGWGTCQVCFKLTYSRFSALRTEGSKPQGYATEALGLFPRAVGLKGLLNTRIL